MRSRLIPVSQCSRVGTSRLERGRRALLPGRTGFPLAVDCGKGHEGAAEDEQVGKGEGQAQPINPEHGGRATGMGSWFRRTGEGREGARGRHGVARTGCARWRPTMGREVWFSLLGGGGGGSGGGFRGLPIRPGSPLPNGPGCSQQCSSSRRAELSPAPTRAARSLRTHTIQPTDISAASASYGIPKLHRGSLSSNASPAALSLST